MEAALKEGDQEAEKTMKAEEKQDKDFDPDQVDEEAAAAEDAEAGNS